MNNDYQILIAAIATASQSLRLKPKKTCMEQLRTCKNSNWKTTSAPAILRMSARGYSENDTTSYSLRMQQSNWTMTTFRKN